MKNRRLQIFIQTAFGLALGILVLSVPTMAQGRYANVYSKRDVSGIIAKLERSSNEFQTNFSRNLNQSNLNGTNEEDRLNRIVSDYENALDRLRRDFDRTDNWWNSRNNVQEVMREARPVNRMMNNLPFARRLERQWNNMRRDLNKLAETYDLPALGDGEGGGGGGGNVPSWAVGNFYGRNPVDGRVIALTINDDGTALVNIEGIMTNASISRDILTVDGARARVTRLKNGNHAGN